MTSVDPVGLREPVEEVDEHDYVPDVDFDVYEVLGSLDTMSAQRPIAAQIVALTRVDESGAREVARLLAADVALAGRVLKLANSAYYGLAGRVSSLQFAVTVVGFSTVRSMASVALTTLDEGAALPADHWTTSVHLALGCSALAPRLGHRAQDALCTGLLAQLGAALLNHHDPVGYAEVVTAEPGAGGRRQAESDRYGVHAVELSTFAMRHWGFPRAMITPLAGFDDTDSVDGGLLRGAFEITGRLTAPGHGSTPVHELTCGRVRERDLVPALVQVRTEADELRQALLN